jgi:hypothetical protein
MTEVPVSAMPMMLMTMLMYQQQPPAAVPLVSSFRVHGTE